MVEGFLNLNKEDSGTRKSNYHQPQLYEDLVPFVHAHPFLGGLDGVHDFLYTFGTVQG